MEQRAYTVKNDLYFVINGEIVNVKGKSLERSSDWEEFSAGVRWALFSLLTGEGVGWILETNLETGWI